MSLNPHMRCARATARSIEVVAGSVLAVAALASFPGAALAENHISVGAAGTTIDVNGASIPTSELTLAELGQLQGVPPSTVNAELEGVAAGTPAASAVDAVVSKLTGLTPLATALDEVAGASGGAITPRSALLSVIGDNGQPGAAGSDGSPGGAGGAGGGGSSGANGSATGANGGGPSASPTAAGARGKLALRASSRSLKGRPRSHVRLSFSVSSAARIIYGGRNLATGYRVARSGKNVIVITLPSKPGTYHLTLLAFGVSEVQSAQTTVVLRDSRSSAGKRHH